MENIEVFTAIYSLAHLLLFIILLIIDKGA